MFIGHEDTPLFKLGSITIQIKLTSEVFNFKTCKTVSLNE